MNILVLSRQEAEAFTPDKPTALISIRDPGQVVNIDKDKYLSVLELEFHDIEALVMNYMPMSVGHSQKVVDWLADLANNYPPFDCIVVHCEAGISRSSAMAAALALWFDIPDHPYWDQRYFVPNRHVYQLMCNVLGVKPKWGKIMI